MSRDETIGLLVALACAFLCALFLLGLPASASAEEPTGETSAENPIEELQTTEVLPEDGDEAATEDLSGDPTGELLEGPYEDNGNALGETSDPWAQEVGDTTSDERVQGAGDTASDDSVQGIDDAASSRSASAPAPSNLAPLVIVVAIMGVALAIAFVVSRIHAKPRKLGGAKGDVW